MFHINRDHSLVVATILSHTSPVLHLALGDLGVFPDGLIYCDYDAGDIQEMSQDHPDESWVAIRQDNFSVAKLWHDAGDMVYLWERLDGEGSPFIVAKVVDAKETTPARWYRFDETPGVTPNKPQR